MTDLKDRIAQMEEGVITSGYALVITKPLTQAEWAALGRDLGKAHDGIQWRIGDWLLYGREALATRGGWRRTGSIYDYAAEITGLAPVTLGVWLGTSERFPPETRDVRVSWSHYREARDAPGVGQERAWLQRALDANWSSRELQAQIRSAREALTPPELRRGRKVGTPNRPKPHNSVRCPHCGTEFPIQGHRLAVRKRPLSATAAAERLAAGVAK